jgi:phosphomannomutase
VRICTQAVADYLKQTGLASRGLIIGYDTRFASEDFAQTAAEVASGNGIKVYLTPMATPTPVVSYGVQYKKAGGAIVITASPNGMVSSINPRPVPARQLKLSLYWRRTSPKFSPPAK